MTPLDVPTLDLSIYSNLSVHDTQGRERVPHHACTVCLRLVSVCFIAYRRKYPGLLSVFVLKLSSYKFTMKLNYRIS